MRHALLPAVMACALLGAAEAHEIAAPPSQDVSPAFDIVRAAATARERLATFVMEVAGAAGSESPNAVGRLPGAPVDAYVWATRLPPTAAGFALEQGILALAVTAHPDFDDTPLFDENGDGDPGNDGAEWHTHWVVLGEDAACAAGLKVLDISPGDDVLPPTAPGLPIALDSPGMSPIIDGSTVRVTVPVEGAAGIAFDAVTAELSVHDEGGVPLLCVTGVRKIASGDLSFPGVIMPEQ